MIVGMQPVINGTFGLVNEFNMDGEYLFSSLKGDTHFKFFLILILTTVVCFAVEYLRFVKSDLKKSYKTEKSQLGHLKD